MTTRKVALVTGGSRGIGRAVVSRLARDGYDVAFCYHSRADAATALAEELRAAGAHAMACRVDVASASAVRRFVAAVQTELGPVDVVVTSAGIVRDSPLALMEDEEWHSVIDTNLSGVYNVCRATAFEMMKRRSGCIVNISSVAGVHGNATQSNYSASKAGMIGFTKALAKELGRFNVRAVVVAPGFITTDMTAALSDSARDRAVKNVALGRFGRADEVADMVSYVVGAEYVTGAVLQIDGGIVM